ncbi:3'-5' exonuclease, partial [Coemansia sp. RSA 2607]
MTRKRSIDADDGPQDTVVAVETLARRSKKRSASKRPAQDLDADDIVDALLGDPSPPKKKKKKNKKTKPAKRPDTPEQHSNTDGDANTEDRLLEENAEEDEQSNDEQYDDVDDLYAWSDNEENAAEEPAAAKAAASASAEEPATFTRDTPASSEQQPEKLPQTHSDNQPEQSKKPPKLTVKVPQEKRDALGRYLAIDCEMVGAGHKGSRSLLARVSLVNYYGTVILDTFVAPTEYVTDYRTWISGVRRSDLKDAPSFKQVQQQVSDLTKDRILIGHAIKNDLSALMLSHPPMLIRDTSKYEGFRVPGKGVPSLKVLAKERLGIDIQNGEHSSV